MLLLDSHLFYNNWLLFFFLKSQLKLQHVEVALVVYQKIMYIEIELTLFISNVLIYLK